MALDWFSFLRQHSIPYTTTGPNASRGRVNIRCPFCGEADPSEHMGISINGHGWSCWRNAQHRGRSNARLVSAILKCSLQEANRIVGGGTTIPTDDELSSSLRTQLGDRMDDAAPTITSLELLPEFKSMDNRSPFATPFLNYLFERGYKATQLKWLIETYRLHYASRGRFAYRIIIPIYDRWNELLTWTARSILPDEELRYKTLKRHQQLCSPKETLLGLPLLWNCPNPRALIICEGPFDAFWITAFGRSLGVYATCLFGLTMSDQQASLLLGLRERFEYMSVLLDSAASFQAFRMSSSGLELSVDRLPDHVKDPAELRSGDVVDLCAQIISKKDVRL